MRRQRNPKRPAAVAPALACPSCLRPCRSPALLALAQLPSGRTVVYALCGACAERIEQGGRARVAVAERVEANLGEGVR